MKVPLGIRQHNPGNVVASWIDWDGEVKPAQGRYATFRAPWWGIRCMGKIILNYYFKRQLKTVAAIIHRYAPGHENPTDSYVEYVAKALAVQPGTLLAMDFATLETMVAAMVHFENGIQPYTWEIRAGLLMTGLEPLATVEPDGQISYQVKRP